MKEILIKAVMVLLVLFILFLIFGMWKYATFERKGGDEFQMNESVEVHQISCIGHNDTGAKEYSFQVIVLQDMEEGARSEYFQSACESLTKEILWGNQND